MGDGVVGGALDLGRGAMSIVSAPVDAVTTTVGGIVSAPFKGASALLMGNGEQQLRDGDTGQSAAVDAALKNAEKL
jgi:hypothetical protein